MLQMKPVTTQEDIRKAASLAAEIWNECYSPILSQGQIDYMLETIQSEDAISKQIKEDGYEYFFVMAGGAVAGYLGLQAKNGGLYLSKIYLLREHRGRGYTKDLFRFMEEHAKSRGCTTMWLTVNRHNAGAVAAYKARGFDLVREQVADIGNGYTMDDYVFEKAVK